MQSGAIRRWISKLHRWIGLGLGAAVAFVGLTGSAVVFQPEIDRWLNPGLHFVAARAPDAAPAVPVQRLLEAARTAHPYGPPGFVNLRLPRAPDRSVSVLMKDRFGKGSAPFYEVFLDPATARVLGARHPEDTLTGILIALHVHWLAGEHGPGETAVGLLGGVLILFCASGLYLWWPRRGAWRGAVSVRRSQGSYWSIYDLHKLLGAASAIPLVLAGLTGLFLVFPKYLKPPLQAVLHAPAPAPAPRSVQQDGGTPLPVDRVLEIAAAMVPDGRPTAVQVPLRGTGAFQVRLREPGDRAQHYSDGAVVAYVDQYSGAALEVRRTADRGVAARLLFDWIFPTHTGEIAGLIGRLLMFFAGLVPAGLFGTGLYLWLRRRALRRGRARGTAQRPGYSESI